MDKYTAGPWQVDQYGHVYGWDSAEGEAYVRTNVVLLDGRYSKATFSDKVLIAAAPDLLAALEGLEEYVSRWYDKPHGLLKEARAAIAKAKGLE